MKVTRDNIELLKQHAALWGSTSPANTTTLKWHAEAVEFYEAILRSWLAGLKAVAEAARAVRAGAVPHPEHTGLVKIILHAADWQALSDALDALDNNQGRYSQVERRMTNDELLVE